MKNIKKTAKLYKVSSKIKGSLYSDYIIAMNEGDYLVAYENTFHVFKEHCVFEGIEQLKPNNKNDSWKWYEFALDKKLNCSLIISVNALK